MPNAAALELAITHVFAQTTDIDWHPTEMAKLAQVSKNKWVGVDYGIMNQLAIANGDASGMYK